MPRTNLTLVVSFTTALTVALSVVAVSGQARKQPDRSTGTGQKAALRTAWGDPDLGGIWTNSTTTPLERPAALAGRQTLNEREAAELPQPTADAPPPAGDPGTYNEFWWERGRRSTRTSLVVDPSDGRIPPLTPEAERREKQPIYNTGRSGTDSWLDRSLYERCITRGMPDSMIPGFYNHNYHIFQTRDYVAILIEMIHDVRIIPLDGRPHVNSSVGLWLGDARGRWEGDTLVVDTTNFTYKNSYRGSREGLHLVERFRRVDADTIDYQFTVDDPKTFTRPWTVATPMARTPGPVYEYACHEGNYGMYNLLVAARAEEQAAKERAK